MSFRQGVFDTTLYDKFVSNLRQVGGFFLGSQVSSTIKTDHHDITEILLNVALNTINQTKNSIIGDNSLKHKQT
jgi:hypothetical protein